MNVSICARARALVQTHIQTCSFVADTSTATTILVRASMHHAHIFVVVSSSLIAVRSVKLHTYLICTRVLAKLCRNRFTLYTLSNTQTHTHTYWPFFVRRKKIFYDFLSVFDLFFFRCFIATAKPIRTLCKSLYNIVIHGVCEYVYMNLAWISAKHSNHHVDSSNDVIL